VFDAVADKLTNKKLTAGTWGAGRRGLAHVFALEGREGERIQHHSVSGTGCAISV